MDLPIRRRDTGARFMLLAASFVVVISGLRAASSVLVPFMIALFLALISLPLMNGLMRIGLPRPLAVLLTIVTALLALAVVTVIIGGSLRGLTDEAPRYRAGLDAFVDRGEAWLAARGLELPGGIGRQLFNPGDALDLVTGTLRGVTAVLSNLLLVLLTVAFILLEAAGFPTKVRAALAQSNVDGGDGWARFANVREEIQRYLGIKTAVSLATGSIVAAAMAILGVDFPLLWGLIAFVLNYIPARGAIIASIPPVMLALVQHGPSRALAVAVVFIAVNALLGNFLEPQLMGRRLGLSALVVFMSLVFWGWVWGPVGMLLSVPLTMVIKIMLENTEDLRWLAVLIDARPRRGDAVATDPG